MKLLSLWFLAAVSLAGQAPRLGDIEFYGLRKVSAEKIRKALDLKEGDPLPPSKGELEDRLESIPGVVLGRAEAVCCERGTAVLFIGIEEKGAPHFALRSEPAGTALLPENLVETYGKFLEAVRAAARRGSAAEDLTQGHSLMADPDAREYQGLFAVYARDHLDLLRKVLRTSSASEQRAMAAAIIGYAPDKQAVLSDLQYALQDPEESVRANAMRALNAIAVLARREPGRNIRISPTWLIEMLNSIVLSDRTRAATALVTLTEKDGAEVLDQIRQRALATLVEMARWKTLQYALPAYILVGRLAGLTEEQIQDAWTKGERETVIQKALKSGRTNK